MKKLLLNLIFVLCSVMAYSQGVVQMPLPPQASTFPGSVRGYWFTSPSCFTITGLEVPTDASTGLQSIAVVRIDTVVPLFPTVTNSFTVLFLTQNDPTTGIIPVNIQVGVGEVIGILGYRDGINSYAPAPYVSSINGFPVTLSRLGMQFNLATTAPQDLWSEAAANLTRVWMYYDANYTFNITQTWLGGTNYSFSNGAGPSSTSVWDYGDGSPLDTALNPTHDFLTPGNYNVCSYITGNCVSDTVCTNVIICSTPALADYNYTINYPTVDFSDLSQNAVSYAWDFGDGSPIDNTANPSHTYSTFGLYTICLSVTDVCGGVNTYCRDVSVCPALIPVSLGSDVVACGNATLSLPGSYQTYNWSNLDTTAQTNITTSGTYDVVVTDFSGCSGADTIVVTINPVPVVSLANGNNNVSICGGLAILLDAQNAGSNYLWSNGATSQTISVTTTGTYSVTVTNTFGCSASDAVTATVFSLPIVALGNDLNICQGFVSINAGNPGSTFLWNTGATTQSILVNSGGTYIVTVTSVNACSSRDTINIVMNAPAVNYPETQTQVCQNGGIITLTPGTPAGGTYSGPGVSGNQFNPVVAGLGNKNVIYAFTDSAGCVGRDTSVINVIVCAGINELTKAGISFYPNPGSDYFYLNTTQIADLVTVIDNYGKEILNFTPNKNNLMLDMSKEAKGVYLLRIKDNNGSYSVPFIVIK
jgi:PKD repeat protein